MHKKFKTRTLLERIVKPKDSELTVLVVDVFDNSAGAGFAYPYNDPKGEGIFLDCHHGDRSKYKHGKIKHKQGDLIFAFVQQRDKGFYASYYRPYKKNY